MLLVDATLNHLPEGLGQVTKDLRYPGTVSNTDPESLKEGERVFHNARKKIEPDRNFMSMVDLARNSVVHHGSEEGKTAEEAVAWTCQSAVSREQGYRAQDSQVVEYSALLARACQDLSKTVRS